MSQASDLRYAGKIRDPLFLFTLGAVVLALASSVALRVFVTGTGPSAAHAEEIRPATNSNSR